MKARLLKFRDVSLVHCVSAASASASVDVNASSVDEHVYVYVSVNVSRGNHCCMNVGIERDAEMETRMKTGPEMVRDV